MTTQEWAEIRHFKPTAGTTGGSWGDPSKISKTLVSLMDEWVDLTGLVVTVTYGTQGTHTKDSEHYTGEAADVIVIPGPKCPTLIDAYLAASRFPFQSIGLYPDWELNGIKRGGLHLGVRPQAYRHLWMGIKQETGENLYLALDASNLKKYGVL